jgi:hypothetical protein
MRRAGAGGAAPTSAAVARALTRKHDARFDDGR